MNIKGFKDRDGVVHKYDHGSLANIPETSEAVKSVNGITPDENGNVEIKIPEGSGGVSDYPELTNKPKINGVEVSGDKTSADYGIGNPTNEQVAQAVQTYLDEHPDATTTVADGSITEQKLADGAVSAQKTDFIRFDGTSANLFNKNAVTEGYELQGYNEIIANASYCISDYIPVETGAKYFHTYKGGRHIHYFDSTKAFISATLVYGNFTTPANCAYIRIELPIVEKDEWMVVKGNSMPSEYIPYAEYYSLNGAVKVAVENVKDLEALFASAPDGSISESALSELVQAKLSNESINTAAGWNDVRQPTKKITGRINVFEKTVKGVFEITSDISDKTIIVHGVNYFDKNDLVPGKINNSNGSISDSTSCYYTSRLIPVQPGKKLYCTRNNTDGVRSYAIFHLYGANQEWLRYDTWGGSNSPKIFTPGDDVYYFRVYCENLVNADAEKLCIADVDIGNTVSGNYDGNATLGTSGIDKTYFGKNVYFPYVGYRIENGALIGASDTYTLEEITHVDVFDSAATIEVTAPIEAFDQKRLQNVTLKFGRHADTDYVIARIFKNTVTGESITPRVLAFTPGGKTMNTLAKENDFVMAINAGVFNTDDNSCVGVVISDGVVVTDHVDHRYSGSADVLGIDASGNLASYAYETTTADMLATGVVGAVSGKNTLIANYAKYDLELAGELLGDTTLCTTEHPRTAIGQYKNGDYMVFTCGGRETNQAGMTCAEMQEIFVAEGLKYAYNLDGGGSCNMMFFKKELALHTENRADPSYIVFE